MDVTCDRCQTQYEFDDALVSEAGTSVRCTQCGFKFRVRREGAAAPEVWVVRTVDGRELEFRALRDLKTSISTGRIGRDDVLSRGAGRPRRLASIAELEPFFTTRVTATSTGLGDEPRPRSRTPHGLGPLLAPGEGETERSENSVAFSLPKLAQEDAAKRGQTAPAASRTARRAENTANYGTPLTGPESVEPSTNPYDRPFDRAKRVTPRGLAPPQQAAAHMPLNIADDDITQAKARSGVGAAQYEPRPSLTGTTPGTGPRAIRPPDEDDETRTTTKPLTARELLDERPRANEGEGASHAGAGSNGSAPAKAEVRSSPPAAPRATERRGDSAGPRSDAPAAAVSDAPSANETPNPQRARDSEAPAASRSGALPMPPEAPPEREAREDSFPPPQRTPTPPEMRFSMSGEDGIGSDPRFTALSARSGTASGSTRLIVGILVLGALAFIGVLLVQKFVLQGGAKTPAKQDDRVTTLLNDGEKALHDGDLDGANDQFVRANEVAQGDARPAKALARLANIRAEFPCLKAKLLAESDTEHETAVTDCTAAASKAQKAVQKARGLAANDAEVTRAEVDEKRLLGDLPGARALVAGMSEVQAQPESALVLAALDLEEAHPPWDSVIDRLTKATADEGDLGRGRALLVYALARKGDVKKAREELAKIAKTTRPHPLKASLGKYLDRVEKGDLPARVDELPSASASPSASVGPTAQQTTQSLLTQAAVASRRRDFSTAERLYQQVIDREPNNSEALQGMADVARERGNTTQADELNKRALEQNNSYVPALLSSADAKWASGDHQGAAALYARALELEPNGSFAVNANDRITIARREASETPPSSTSSGGANPPTTNSATAPPASAPTHEPQTPDAP